MNFDVYTQPMLMGGDSTLPVQSKSGQSAQGDGFSSSDFQQLMTVMLMGSFNMGGDSGAGSGGMDMSAVMAPLMLTLLEKLMAGQVESEKETETKVEMVDMPVSIQPRDVPSGMPIRGQLTQSAHPGHMALDFGAPVGSPVKATMDGKVVYAGWNNQGYGNLVIVQNGQYRTYFAHLSKFKVKAGDTIQAGSEVALSGNTGNSTGPHLHYEVRRNGTQLNPSKFL